MIDLIANRWYWCLTTPKRTDGALVVTNPDDPDEWRPLKWTGTEWTNDDCFTDYAVDFHDWKLIPLPGELP